MYYIEYPYLDQDIDIRFASFPGGEPHVNVETIPDHQVTIKYSARTWDDFGDLLVLLNALYHQDKVITLIMPYFPGARQDRNPGGNTPLTVELYAKILAPYVNKLFIADPHSPKAVQIISQHFKTVYVTYPFQILKDLKDKFDFVIAPDSGATTRAGLVAKNFGIPLIQCEKVRDFNTGRITSYEFPGELLPGRYLVVDDICDGGATFNLLGEAFFNKMPSEVLFSSTDIASTYTIHLYVTHPIFSKGFKDILRYYRHVYTTDSLDFYHLDVPEDRLTIIPLNLC